MSRKLISIATPCFNEESNILLMIEKVKSIFETYSDKYDFEMIIIDNSSTDNSVNIIREECKKDKRIKLIINSRNFGWTSSFHCVIRWTNWGRYWFVRNHKN